MSEEQLKAFIAKAKDDQSIQEQLKAAKTPDDVIGVAKEHGHDFGTEHISQLTEEELVTKAKECVKAQMGMTTTCIECGYFNEVEGKQIPATNTFPKRTPEGSRV